MKPMFVPFDMSSINFFYYICGAFNILVDVPGGDGYIIIYYLL